MRGVMVSLRSSSHARARAIGAAWQQRRGKGVGVWGRELGPLVPPPSSIHSAGSSTGARFIRMNPIVDSKRFNQDWRLGSTPVAEARNDDKQRWRDYQRCVERHYRARADVRRRGNVICARSRRADIPPWREWCAYPY